MTKTVMSGGDQTPIADLGCGFFLPLAVEESAMIGHTYHALHFAFEGTGGHICYSVISGRPRNRLRRQLPLPQPMDQYGSMRVARNVRRDLEIIRCCWSLLSSGFSRAATL